MSDNTWKDAIENELVICGILNDRHKDPRVALSDIIQWNTEVALYFEAQNSTRHCKNCKDWAPYSERYPKSWVDDSVKAGGLCESSHSYGSNKLWTEDGFGQNPRGVSDLLHEYDVPGGFWTGPEFGCVNFIAKNDVDPLPETEIKP